MSSDTYKAVLDGLQVETNPSFLRRDVTGDKVPETFCNRAVEAACKKTLNPVKDALRKVLGIKKTLNDAK